MHVINIKIGSSVSDSNRKFDWPIRSSEGKENAIQHMLKAKKRRLRVYARLSNITEP